MNVSEAIAHLKKGGKVRHKYWGPTDPTFLVFVPGRIVKASFPPMSELLGEGVEFLANDHIDAVWASIQDDVIIGATVTLGYQFRQWELFSEEWEAV